MITVWNKGETWKTTWQAHYRKEEEMSKTAKCNYMISQFEFYTDSITGEIDESALAEDCCDHFGIPLDADNNAPDNIWKWAYTLSRQQEIKTGVREPKVKVELTSMLNHVNSTYDLPRIAKEQK